MNRRFVVLALVVLSAGAFTRADHPANVAGTWLLSVDVGDTHGMPTVVLNQKGATLTGTLTNPRGQQMLTGTVDGKEAVFSFQAVREGQALSAVYRGTLESRKKMSGTVDFTGALTGSGTWVGIRK